MARPKEGIGPSAQQRIEEAYWALLESMPHEKITIGQLCTKAHINHNTFYYHYQSIDDLVNQILERLVVSPSHISFISHLFRTDELPSLFELFSQAHILSRLEKIRIVVGPHGTHWMKKKCEEAVLTIWFNLFKIDQTKLSQETHALLTFHLGGILALFSSEVSPEELFAFLRSEKAREYAQILLSILGSCPRKSEHVHKEK